MTIRSRLDRLERNEGASPEQSARLREALSIVFDGEDLPPASVAPVGAGIGARLGAACTAREEWARATAPRVR
jgi:hypothetical protein